MTVPMMPQPRSEHEPEEPEFFKDAHGEWRWRRIGVDGELYAASHQGFRSKWGAKRNWKRTRR